MAVLDGLEGIEVTICVDSQALHEYNGDEAEAQLGAISTHQASVTVSKYIEAATGKEFAITTAVKSPYKMNCPTLAFYTKVDGKNVEVPLLFKPQYQDTVGWEHVTSGIKHNLGGISKRCSIKHFQFAEIQTSEPLKSS
jgi:hypothetical protein